jgi:hypothetical protein
MPWGMGGGPWWAYPELRRYWWRCWRFPWLPRGWWAFPEYFGNLTPEEEKKMLKENLEALREEMKAIEERLKELEKKK